MVRVKSHGSMIEAASFLGGYRKCSKMSNPSCLTKRPGQTVQNLKQSNQGLPCLLF